MLDPHSVSCVQIDFKRAERPTVTTAYFNVQDLDGLSHTECWFAGRLWSGGLSSCGACGPLVLSHASSERTPDLFSHDWASWRRAR